MEFKICKKCERVELYSAFCSKCNNSLTIVEENYFIGKIFGKYILKSAISSGGMGIIYKASHITLNKIAAVKILIPEIANPEFLKRFEREAQVLAELKHPNIVEIYDFDLSSYELPFFVMEFLEGSNLREEIKKFPMGIPYDLFCKYIHQICSALNYAHSKGIVHRDLKPENIFIQKIAEEEIIKVLDFGIAKILVDTEVSNQLTLTGSIIGTPYYIAPEQIAGKNIGPHTDQYSLALIVAEMLTGKPVREGKSFSEIITKEMHESVKIENILMQKLPKNIASAINRATQPDTNLRFNKIYEFEKELVSAKTSSEYTTIDIKIPISKKRNLKIIAIFSILSFLISLILFINYSSKRIRPINIQQFSLPSDADSLLGYTNEYLIVKGLETLYALDVHNLKSQPIKLYFKKDETFLSFLSDSSILFLNNNSLWKRYYYFEEKLFSQDKLILKELPKFNEIGFSISGDSFFIENDANIEAYTIKEEVATNIFEFKKNGSKPLQIAISDKYIVLVFKDNLKVFDLSQNKNILNESIPIGTASVILSDLANMLFIGGWYDEVIIFDLKSKQKKTIASPGKTFSIQYLPDNPTLLISKLEKFIIWDLNNDKEILKIEKKGSLFRNATLGLNGIYVYDESKKHLFLIPYRSFKEKKILEISELPIWALSFNKFYNKIFCGGEDGIIYEINIQDNKIIPYKLHTQGITSIISEKDYLVSSSDDKTIAVWKLPEMKLLYRSQSHNYLINSLYLPPTNGIIWSSSSDGSIKKLNLPSLQEIEVIKIGDYSFHSFWVNKEENFLIAGTWNNRFIFIKKIKGKWQVEKEIPVNSKGIYSNAYLPNINIIVFIGIQPSSIFIYDLKYNNFMVVKYIDLNLSWIQKISSTEAIGSADNSLIYFKFERKGKKIICNIKISINSNLKIPDTSEYLQKESLFLNANSNGEIIFSSFEDLFKGKTFTLEINSSK